MNDPVLTPSDLEALNFLQTKSHRRGSRRTPVKRTSLYEDRLRIAQQAVVGGCVYNPSTKSIEYHSETVHDADDQETVAIEIVETDYIAKSHNIADQVYVFQEQIATHWKNIQASHVLAVMDLTLFSKSNNKINKNTRYHGNTGASCGSVLASVRDGVMHATMWSSQRATNRKMKAFRCNSARRPGIQKSRYAVESSVGNAAFHLIRWRLRRQYMYQQQYSETANAAYYAGRQNPDAIFELLQSASGMSARVEAGSILDAERQKQSSLSKFGQIVGIGLNIATFFAS